MSKRHVVRDKAPATPPAARPGSLTASQVPAAPQVGPGVDRAATGATAERSCPGSCNAAYRAAQAAYESAFWRWVDTIDEHGHTDHPEPEPHGVEFEPGSPVWCASVWAPVLGVRGEVTTERVYLGCQDRIGRALTHIEQWLIDVPTSGPLMMAAPAERHGTGSLPSPSPAFDEIDAFGRWLADMARRLAERAGHTGHAGDRLAYVREWLTALLSGPDAEADGQAILAWERRLRAIVGAQTVTRMPGTCPSCDRRGTLRHRNGSDFIRCQSCSVVIEWDDYHRQIGDIADATPGPARRTA